MATNNSINSNIPIEISKGGTNATTMATTDGVVYYDGIRLVTSSAGTAGQLLTSNGAGVAPTYQTAKAAACAFSAYPSATINDVTGNNANYTVIFDTKLYDIGSNYNNTTGIFTAPNTGKYFFHAQIVCENITTLMNLCQLSIVVSGTSAQTFYTYESLLLIAAAFYNPKITNVVTMTAGDTAKIVINISNGTGNTVDIAGGNVYTTFTGYQLF